MSAPKAPAQQQVLPLLDPNNVSEMFANELAGIHLQDGNCHFTLSVVRPKHTNPNANEQERVIAARLVVTARTADMLVKAYEQLKSAVRLGQMNSEGPIN